MYNLPPLNHGPLSVFAPTPSAAANRLFLECLTPAKRFVQTPGTKVGSSAMPARSSTTLLSKDLRFLNIKASYNLASVVYPAYPTLNPEPLITRPYPTLNPKP